MTAANSSLFFTPVILIHTMTALVARALDTVMFLLRQGTLAHRKLGRGCATLMLVIILSSFFIRTSGSFSWTHLLSVGSLLALSPSRLGSMPVFTRVHRGTLVIWMTCRAPSAPQTAS